MSDLRRPSDELRAAVVLLGGVRPVLTDVAPDKQERIQKLVDAATRRVMRVVMLLEPKRAKLAK